MYGNNPYGYPYPQYGAQMAQGGYMPQGVNQYQLPTQNASTGAMEVIPVQTVEQIEQVQLQPGQRKMVMVQNDPIIAARVADNMGLVTTEYYRLEKYDPHAAAPAAPAVEYVTREEFEQFVASLKPATKKKEAAAE